MIHAGAGNLFLPKCTKVNIKGSQSRNRLLPPLFNTGVSETAMHWRKVPEKSNGKVFYGVVLALTTLVAVSTALLVFHFLA
jgi:hypothetical protein